MPELPALRVLVVDDEDDMRRALDKSLRRFGYEVFVASDGNEALRIATDSKPEIVVTDLRMPGIDGHTLIRRLRAQGSNAAVIVMSGDGTMDDVVDALRNGAVDYLKKPWTASELVAAIGRATESLSAERPSLEASKAPSGLLPAPAVRQLDTQRATATATATPMSEVITLIEQVRRGDTPLPVIPTVLGELRKTLRKPDAGMDEIAALVERDGRLAAQLLRTANAAHAARSTRCNNVRAAVGLVGLRQVSGFVEAILAKECFAIRHPFFREKQTKVWRYSIARAVAMRGLADITTVGTRLDPETAYLSGLLADTGASFLLWVLAQKAPEQGTELDSWLTVVQQHHEEFGAAILRIWAVDETAVNLALSHHSCTPPAPPNPYWSLSVLAETLADELVGTDPTRLAILGEAVIERCAVEHRIGLSAVKKLTTNLAKELRGILEGLG